MFRRLALCLAFVWVVYATPTPPPFSDLCRTDTVLIQNVVFSTTANDYPLSIERFTNRQDNTDYYGLLVGLENTQPEETATITAFGNTSLGVTIIGSINCITVPSVSDSGLVLISIADMTTDMIEYGVPPGGPIISSVTAMCNSFTDPSLRASVFSVGYTLYVDVFNPFGELCRLASTNFSDPVNVTTDQFLFTIDEQFYAYRSEIEANGILNTCPCPNCMTETYEWTFLSLTGASLGAIPILDAFDPLAPTAPYFDFARPADPVSTVTLFNLPADYYTAVFSVQVGDFLGGETVIFSLEFYSNSPVPVNSYPIHPPIITDVFIETPVLHSAPPSNQIVGAASYVFVEKIPNIAIFAENITLSFFGVDATLPSSAQPSLADCQSVFPNTSVSQIFNINMLIQVDPVHLASVQASMDIEESIVCTFRLAIQTNFMIQTYPAAAYTLFNITIWGNQPIPTPPLPQPPAGDLGIMGYYNLSAVNVNPTKGEWVFGGYLVLTGIDTEDYICAPGPGLMNYNSTSFNGSLFDPSYFFTPLCTTSATNFTMPSDRLVPQLSVACDAGVVVNPAALVSSLYGPCVNTSNGNSIAYIIQFGVWDVTGINASAIASSFMCTVTANQTTAGFGITNTTFVFQMPPLASPPYLDPSLFGRLVSSAPSSILQTDGSFIPVKRSNTKRYAPPPTAYVCDQTEVLEISIIDLAAKVSQSLEGPISSRRRSVALSNSTILLIGSLSLIADSIIENINNQTALAIIIANQTGISIDNATLIATQLYNFYVIVVNNEPTPAPTIPPTTPPPTAEPFTTSKGWYIWGLTAIPLTGFLAALVGGMVVYLGLQGSAQKAKGFKKKIKKKKIFFF
jgi:hypothetical protein